MSGAPLAGAGVLVTRPAQQAGSLCAAVERAGGHALRFPVMDIVGRDPESIARELVQRPAPDLAIFVSGNAVRHGSLAMQGAGLLAAVGEATAAALTAAGRGPDIVPAGGADSESLLDEPALHNVRHKRVLIVRGDDGRELLGRTLAARGAQVGYLAVYERRRHEASAGDLAMLGEALRNRQIHYVTTMSVASFGFLLDLLPADGMRRLAGVQLVAPAARVIKTALDRVPGMRALEATGPRAEDMVAAIIADWQQTDRTND